jgi:hypothetical protein
MQGRTRDASSRPFPSLSSLLARDRFTDPQTGVAPGVTRGRNVRSKCRCSMCPAIHITSRSWLRSSSTHEPSDPPLGVVFFASVHSKRDIVRDSKIPPNLGQMFGLLGFPTGSLFREDGGDSSYNEEPHRQTPGSKGHKGSKSVGEELTPTRHRSQSHPIHRQSRTWSENFSCSARNVVPTTLATHQATCQVSRHHRTMDIHSQWVFTPRRLLVSAA